MSKLASESQLRAGICRCNVQLCNDARPQRSGATATSRLAATSTPHRLTRRPGADTAFDPILFIFNDKLEEVRDNLTVSVMSFVPTLEDDGKAISCRAENPNVTALHLETSWTISVVSRWRAATSKRATTSTSSATCAPIRPRASSPGCTT
ncbi:hypothetical protein MSG28_002579 [Choristoneura fumiferana]|uniref:Uncharacterized protein n=1 Tax=Choristoneura fumiferana TaxID=7141 RepID=A0ACC0JWP9_CHOFU|nr:hypothetical protein MSG28_002579 [Choristoneura fumiferana]